MPKSRRMRQSRNKSRNRGGAFRDYVPEIFKGSMTPTPLAQPVQNTMTPTPLAQPVQNTMTQNPLAQPPPAETSSFSFSLPNWFSNKSAPNQPPPAAATGGRRRRQTRRQSRLRKRR